ncbi:MAG: hypothetical protein IJY50_04725 [Clostridia bacterium]|nr:hypothetical protein [Clostridia bacterium]
MKAVIRLLVLAAIVGTIVVMVKTGTGSTVIGGAVVILVLLLVFRKTVTPSRRNRSQGGSGGGSRSLPSHSEIMQIINDYVGYYATGFNCNITPNHIYITVTFSPGTSAALANQKAMDLCNEISSTYGISVSVN